MVISLERGADCLHIVQLMPLHHTTPPSLASFKSRPVLAFWYQLTQVFLETGLLFGCSSSSCCCCCGATRTAEADAGCEHHRVGGVPAGRGVDGAAVGGSTRTRAGRPTVLAVPVGDRRARLPDGMGQRHADQRHVACDAPHLVQLEGGRADHHRRAVLPRDEAAAVVDQRADGRRRGAVVRHGPHARGTCWCWQRARTVRQTGTAEPRQAT